jgi:hypothetical protein
MPFSWYHADLPENLTAQWPQKFEQMYAEGIKQHALLLQRLGHPRDYAKQRISSNMRWEFEQMKLPNALYERIGEIVNQVYGS